MGSYRTSSLVLGEKMDWLVSSLPFLFQSDYKLGRVLLSVLCFLGLLGSISEVLASDQGLPNIVLLMGDDHGWEETGYNGHPYLKTPVLDEIARTGLCFNRFHAAHPNCSPTRASFLTGRHPNRMGTFAPGYSFRPEEITIAHLLSQAGYRCGHYGKWHVGAVKADSPVNPGAMGFHEWLSHDNFFELNPTLSRNGRSLETIPGESSEILIKETIQFIERTIKSRTKLAPAPFLAVVWFGSPHEPYSGLPDDLSLYDHLATKYSSKNVSLTSNATGRQTTRPQGEVLRERYAEITAMDRAIGQLRSYLEETGQRDNTLLFYCGDNGTSADGLLKSPHRGHKGQIYEGGTLVPGLIEWPARIATNQITDLCASTSDLLPTLAALVNQDLPQRPLDGMNLWPLIESDCQERPMPMFFWEFNTKRSGDRGEPYIAPELQLGTTPLVKLSGGGKATRDFLNFKYPSIQSTDYTGPRAIISGDYKLIHQEVDNMVRTEIFDLRKDPAEQTDLRAQHPELIDQLSQQLKQWQQGVLESLTGADY